MISQDNKRKTEQDKRKVADFMRTVLAYILFGAVLYLVCSACDQYYTCNVALAKATKSVAAMRKLYQGEIRQMQAKMQAKAFTMEQALQQAESRGVAQLDELHQLLTIRHDKEMEKQADECAQALRQGKMEFSAQLEHVRSRLAAALDEKANTRTATEAFAESIQAELVAR
jgi:hypothetical protein